jgi:hypothetical protein
LVVFWEYVLQIGLINLKQDVSSKHFVLCFIEIQYSLEELKFGSPI